MTARCSAWPRTAAPARIPQRCGCSAARLSCCPRRSASSAWRSTAACSPRSARDDSPLRRISWVERALPGDPDALGGYLLDAKRADASLEDPPYELVSYLRLIGRAGHVAEEHELLFALQIDARRPAARRPVARLGGGDLGAMAVLAGEVGRLIELLDGAGITPTGVLTRRGLAAAIRDGYDPWGRRQRHRDQDPDRRVRRRAAQRRARRARRALVAPPV